MKRSIVLLEVIVSLVLFSIIAIVSLKMTLTLSSKNSSDTHILKRNLLLETTRLFLSKNNAISKIEKIDSNLYFENTLLLEDISHYEKSQQINITTINICIENNTICQIWKIKE